MSVENSGQHAVTGGNTARHAGERRAGCADGQHRMTEMDTGDCSPRARAASTIMRITKIFGAGTSSTLWVWAVVFAVAILATQLGSLEREVIDMDESTFILMASHVLAGYLPYVELYDNKPPMVYFLLAGAMWAFGESLLVVRLFGAFCLWISCIAVFAIAARYATRMHAALAAFLLIAVHSVKYGQYTSAELPATAALMGALWICIAHKRSLLVFAAIGVLMSLATLTRSNLVVVPISFGSWLAIATLRSSSGIRRQAVVAFGIAGLAPPAALVGLYWHADALVPLWLGTLHVPASYLDLDGTVWHTMVNGWGFLLDNRRMPLRFLPFTLLLLTGLARSAFIWRQSHDAPQTRTYHEILWLMLGATVLSVQMTGTFRHYWLQVFPICTVFCAFGIGWMLPKQGFRWIGGLLPVVAFVAATVHTFPSAIAIIASPSHLSKRHTIKKAADVIAADLKLDDTLWAFKHHLIYWYLDRMPTSRVLQPNVFGNRSIMEPLVADGYIGQEELKRILAGRPTYLVTKVDRTGNSVPAYARGDEYAVPDLLAAHYRLFYDDRSLSPPGRPTLIYKLRDEREAGGADRDNDSCHRNGPGPERPCDHRDLGL